MELIASLPKPEGFFDPKAPAGQSHAGRAARRPTAPSGRCRRRRDGQTPAAALRRRRAADPGAGEPAELLELGSRVQRPPSLRRQLSRVQRLRHRERDATRGCSPRWSARAARATCRCTAICCSCRSSRRAGRIDCGTQGVQATGQRRAIPRRPHLRHQRRQEAEAGRRRADLPRIAHAHAGHRPRRQGEPLHLRIRHGRGPVRRGARGLLGQGSEGGSEHRALQHRRHPGAARRAGEGADRQPAAHLRRSRRPATSRDSGRAATTGRARRRSRVTNQCHDITVFPELGLAAGACSGNGILMDISDPVNPVRLDQVVDKNFAYWHSATFNNDGTKVIFTDEWGGGSRPRCRATDLPNWGADAIFDIVDRKLRFASYYKMPAAQTEQENCVAHNGVAHPGAGARHHGAGVVPGRRVGVRLHRLGEPGRDRVLRSRPDRRQAADHRRATGRPTGTTATSTAPRSPAASTCSG